MNNIRLRRILSLSVAFAAAVWSVLILNGNVLSSLPPTYRTLFGVIVLLYGIYRMVLGVTMRRQQ